jgi:predicted PurR-regulated permease PerM
MINLGLLDLLLIILLLVTFYNALRRHSVLPFAIMLILVFLIELGRFAPGSFVALQSVVRGIDSINKQLPHIQISSTVTIQ